MQKKISIVVPIYKVPEKYLRQCIESCIHQTLEDIEIILVDDGSPDNCGNICDEYAYKDKRIKVIHKENGGLAAARNSGFDVVTGETMMFLDGDDYLELNCCELTYKTYKEQKVELVMFDQYENYENSQVINHSFNDNLGPRYFDSDECLKLQERVLDFNGKIAMAFQKLIDVEFLRRNNIKHVNYLKQGAEGFVFNIQLYEHLQKAYYLDTPLLHYVYNKQSISHFLSVQNSILIVRCMEWIEDYVKKSKNPINLELGVLDRVLYLICAVAITGYFNPYNPLSFKEKVNGFKTFINESIVKRAIKEAPKTGLNLQRRVVLSLIIGHHYRALWFLGWLRRKQLENK